MKLVEFLGKHRLERQVRLFIRGGVLTLDELEATPDERLGALDLPARQLLILRTALGRKIEEAPPPPAFISARQVKSEALPATIEVSPPQPSGRIWNPKVILLVLCGLVLAALVGLAAFFMHKNLLYESETTFSWPWEKEKPLIEKSQTPAPAVVEKSGPPEHEETNSSFSGYMARYQKALQGQVPSEIVSFFITAGSIEYYQKTVSRDDLLTLLEGDRLNDPILIRSVEDLGVIEPSSSSDPAITWNRFLLRYETKKGKFEKKIRVGVRRNPLGDYMILSEANDGNPVQLDAPPSAAGGEGARRAPYAPVAWKDPGFLSPGGIHQLELIFYGCKPAQQWSLPQVSQLHILGQPSMSQTFHHGRTDLNLLFPIRLLASGEVRIPAFEVSTDQGVVEVPSLALNPLPPAAAQGSTAERSMGRGLPVQRKPKDQQEDVAQVKDFYSPADVFPEAKIGLRLVGKFIVLRFSNGDNYLSADSSRGEKDAMRRFVPENLDLPLGGRYTFTREQPLLISSVSLLGQYGVLVPNDVRPDRY